MIPEFYDKYNSFFDESIHELASVAEKLCIGMTIEDISILQNYLIQFGEKLERDYGLSESLVVREIEKCCELIYQLSESVDDRERFISLKSSIQLSIEEIKSVSNNTIVKTDYHTSIVLIAKNESRYIKEWLEYHILVGISHFYIYDNGSTDDMKDILAPYIDSGYVTYHYFPGELQQMRAYEDALMRYRFDTKYMSFTDADEYLVPVKYDSIPETIDAIIDNYNKLEFRVDYQVGGIGINWRWYGSSGHTDVQEGLLIENYTKRAPNSYNQNAHIKTICNPRCVEKTCGHPHSFVYKKGYYAISEKGSYIPGAFFYDSACEYIRINHYHIKSEKEYYSKWRRGWPDIDRGLKSDDELKKMFDDMIEICNSVEDDIMDKYVSDVKMRMQS